jgi:hypothetical protein
METEFTLLNAKLSEKASNLELAEEQLWRIYSIYQGFVWEGSVEYPNSFNIRDDMKELQKLQVAKSSATDPRVFAWIDHEILEAIGGEADMIAPEIYDPNSIPAKKPFEPHYMIDVTTGEKYIARTPEEHMQYAAQGYVHEIEED